MGDGRPYARKTLFFDVETFNAVSTVAINREGQVWRYFTVLYHLPAPSTEAPLETSAPIWLATIGIDRRRATATVARAMEPTTLPTMTARQIERRFNVSNLTDGR